LNFFFGERLKASTYFFHLKIRSTKNKHQSKNPFECDWLNRLFHQYNWNLKAGLFRKSKVKNGFSIKVFFCLAFIPCPLALVTRFYFSEKFLWGDPKGWDESGKFFRFFCFFTIKINLCPCTAELWRLKPTEKNADDKKSWNKKFQTLFVIQRENR